jgi:imidazolonepropionase-like amidohydrolase
LTLDAAIILGVGDRLGSLDEGKDATLIVVAGDPLEIISAVEMAWIGGRAVDLTSRQTQLYDKYQQRYEQGSE